MIRSLSVCFLSATLLGPAFAQEPPKSEPPPPQSGAATREQRPPLPPGEHPPRSPESRPDGQRPERPPFPPREGERRPEGFPPREGERPRGPEGRRFEGERRPDQPGFPGGERSSQPQPRMKATPYLGVVSSPAHPALAAQLGLNEGFGLVVDEVLPESPAQAAGVQRHDVLKLLNEQQLTDPAQLGALVRSLGKDTEVALTLIRKGQEQKLTMKIGEKMLPERRPEDMRGGPFGSPEMRRGGGGEMPKPPQGPMDAPARHRPGGGTNAPDHSSNPGDMRRTESSEGSSRWDTSRARVKMRDQDGEAELGTENGKRTLTVRNSAGETVFTGPVDTPEQRNAVPEAHRARLTALEAAPPPQPRPSQFEGGPRPHDQQPPRQRGGNVQ